MVFLSVIYKVFIFAFFIFILFLFSFPAAYFLKHSLISISTYFNVCSVQLINIMIRLFPLFIIRYVMCFKQTLSCLEFSNSLRHICSVDFIFIWINNHRMYSFFQVNNMGFLLKNFWFSNDLKDLKLLNITEMIVCEESGW